MEKPIMKSYSPNIKNIRIRNQVNSNSKEKLKLSIKTQAQPSKTNIIHETSNISTLDHSSSVLSFEKVKINPKQRRTSIFFPNKQKKCLVISNKQNVSSNPINVRNSKIQKNFNFDEISGQTKKLSLIQMLQQRQLKEVEQDQLPTPRHMDKKSKEMQIKYNKNNEDLLNYKNFSSEQQENNFLNYKKQCQKLIFERISDSFKIFNQFSFTLNQNFKKVDCQTQTTNSSHQDKYLIQYAKYRQLKQKNFNVFQERQQKINKILSNTKDFQQNYEHLTESIMGGPEDDRQKRVHGLSEDLSKQKFNVNEAFERINDLANRFQQTVQKKIYEIRNKKDLLITSISHLIESSIFLSKKNDSNQNEKLARILERIKNQTRCLHNFALKTGNYGVSTFKQYNWQISNLQKEYEQFTKCSLENRVLLYNCVKQIEKIPTLMVMLFGFDDQPEICQRFKGQQKIQCKFDEYMSAKCEDCYHTKRKIKLLQFHNQKIKPVLKSIKWLLEDKSKPTCCLSII